MFKRTHVHRMLARIENCAGSFFGSPPPHGSSSASSNTDLSLGDVHGICAKLLSLPSSPKSESAEMCNYSDRTLEAAPAALGMPNFEKLLGTKRLSVRDG